MYCADDIDVKNKKVLKILEEEKTSGKRAIFTKCKSILDLKIEFIRKKKKLFKNFRMSVNIILMASISLRENKSVQIKI